MPPAAATTVHAASPAALDRAVSAYDVAQEKGDARALRTLLADDYLLAGSDGTVETKEAFIKDLTTPGYHMNPFHVVRPIVRTWSDGAIEGGMALLTGTSAGHAFSACLRFVDVWMFKDDHWQVAYSQAMKAAVVYCKYVPSEAPDPARGSGS